jgi:hypothetical protein
MADPRPKLTQAEVAARAALLGPAARQHLLTEVLGKWSDADLARLAELTRLGRPQDVLGPPTDVKVTTWPDSDARGCIALRPPSTDESNLRADLLHVWRGVARRIGLPLRGPHDLEDA